MEQLPLVTLLAVVILGLLCRERAHDRERAEWTRERQALLERAAGVRLAKPEAQGTHHRAYGTEEDEWRVELLRCADAELSEP
jgi:hypothetical protein